MLYLIEDVISYNFKTYAVKGEVVTIIGDHGNIVTVESETGNRFATLKTNLSKTKIQKDVIKSDTKIRKVPRR